MRFIQTALIMMLLASPVLVHAATLHRGEWKATERTAQGVQETYTYCDRGLDAGSGCPCVAGCLWVPARGMAHPQHDHGRFWHADIHFHEMLSFPAVGANASLGNFAR